MQVTPKLVLGENLGELWEHWLATAKLQFHISEEWEDRETKAKLKHEKLLHAEEQRDTGPFYKASTGCQRIWNALNTKMHISELIIDIA